MTELQCDLRNARESSESLIVEIDSINGYYRIPEEMMQLVDEAAAHVREAIDIISELERMAQES